MLEHLLFYQGVLRVSLNELCHDFFRYLSNGYYMMEEPAVYTLIFLLVTVISVNNGLAQSSELFVPCSNPTPNSGNQNQDPPLPKLPNQFSVHIEANIVQVGIKLS